jgi:hypothetical protein
LPFRIFPASHPEISPIKIHANMIRLSSRWAFIGKESKSVAIASTVNLLDQSAPVAAAFRLHRRIIAAVCCE